MAMQSIARIGVLSLAKMLAVTYAFLGLFFGGVLSLFALMGAAVGSAAGGDGGGIAAMLFGVGAVIVLPIVYGCLGFVGGLIMAPLYNLVAKVVGGIEVELS
ncbi:MAG TPA: hypothetical protein PKU70_00065 [Vicinamibacteria bacterium]|nr:hypothetical protein [Vicinamibacteria bacterium]HRB11377.1 hypothetical protein [Vicinamibacteria bacterium]